MRPHDDAASADHQELPSLATDTDWRIFYEDRYSNKRKRAVARLKAFHRADNLSLSKRIRQLLPFRCETVFDVGAGESITSIHLGAARIIKTDLAVSTLQVDYTEQHEPDISRVCADASNLPFRDGSCDLLIATQILEHVPDYRLAISEFARVARPGGALVLTVPNSYQAMWRRYHKVSKKIDQAGHLRVFEPRLLQKELNEHFIIIETLTTGYNLFSFLMRIERIERLQALIRLTDRVTHHYLYCAKLVSKMIDLENRLHKHSNGGMSHEIYGVRRP